jgi:polyisoprenoid-binding protein YceI
VSADQLRQARRTAQEGGFHMTATTQTTTATLWKLDTAHSTVEFAVKHMMFTTVKGRFTDVTGTIDFDDSDPSDGHAEISIGAASIDTRDAQRDAHLKSADFFDVEKYPTLTFRSTRVDGTLEHFTLTGDLTIHGVTHPIALDVTFAGKGKDPWGGERFGYIATGTLNRRDFGLTWNAALETGGFLVGDEVKVTLDLQLIRG